MPSAIVTARYPVATANTIRTHGRGSFNDQTIAVIATKAQVGGQIVVGRNHHWISGDRKKTTASTAAVSGRRGISVTSSRYAAAISDSPGNHQRTAIPWSSGSTRKPTTCGRNSDDQSHTGRSFCTLASMPPGKVPLISGEPWWTWDTIQLDWTSHSSVRMARGTPSSRFGSVPVPKVDHQLPVEDPLIPNC